MLHKIVKMKDGWYVKVPYYFSKMDMHRARFDPMTIAMVAMAAGTGLSAYSTIEGGKDAAETGKIQQQQLNAEAKAETIAGMEASGAKREEGRRLTASQIAAISASGGGLVGSNLVVMAESARNVEADALTIERNADTRAKQLRTQGEWARYEGQLARRNARMKATSDVMSAAGQAYMMYKSPQPKKPSIGGGATAKANAWSAARAGG